MHQKSFFYIINRIISLLINLIQIFFIFHVTRLTEIKNLHVIACASSKLKISINIRVWHISHRRMFNENHANCPVAYNPAHKYDGEQDWN